LLTFHKERVTLMLIAFDSTQQALRAEMLLEYADIDIDICPTPKEITAGCALSIEFPDEALAVVKEVITSEKVDIRGIYLKQENKYVTIDISF
jgi:hypothetical protein